jgi:hypothetical protein
VSDFAFLVPILIFFVRNFAEGQIRTIHFANIEAKVARNGLINEKTLLL